MKKPPALVVANWKENFTVPQAKKWLEEFSKFELQIPSSMEIIICPSHAILLSVVNEVSKLKGIKLGTQNVSKFEGGDYPGDFYAKMLKDLVSYVIVGHSDRRRHFGETDADIRLKVELCLKYGLTPIVCLGNLNQARAMEGRSHIVLVYEPVEAISAPGQFHPDDPEHAQTMAKEIKFIVDPDIDSDIKVLYGGSVNSENVKSFVSQPDIDGVLVGQASLDSKEFVKIIRVCQGSDPRGGSDPHLL